ncbi:MAG: hypothetical protein QW506_01575 [Thermoproteota archaeon]
MRKAKKFYIRCVALAGGFISGIMALMLTKLTDETLKMDTESPLFMTYVSLTKMFKREGIKKLRKDLIESLRKHEEGGKEVVKVLEDLLKSNQAGVRNIKRLFKLLK